MTTPAQLKAQLAQAQADYYQEVADIWSGYDGFTPPPDTGEPPDTEPPDTEPPDLDGFYPVADGAIVTLAGMQWQAQSGSPDGVSMNDNNEAIFHAESGENASFDPDRKIRAELGGLTTFAKGVPCGLSGKWIIDRNTAISNSEWCSVIQVHQADTRRADGSPVASSPPFSVEIILKNGEPTLQVRAETGTGVPAPNTWPPHRVLGQCPMSFGVEHDFEVEFVDGHGYDGSVWVKIDDVVVVDFTGPTGFEYVDLLADAYLVNGKPQPTESYPKLGVYAGVGSGDEPPPDTYVGYLFRFA